MMRQILLIGTCIAVLCTSVTASCPKSCTCLSNTVECNNFNFEPFEMHIFSLKITNPPESVILNKDIFNFTGLASLNTITIENATIINIDDSTFSSTPLLSTLQFINCNFPSIDNLGIFSKCTSLRTLKISNSHLYSFENIKSDYIEELVLSGNQLKAISKDSFSNIPSLTYINLSDNFISSIDAEAFTKLLYLQELSLSNNKLANLDPDLLKTNTELITLDLSYNPLKKFDIRITADLEKLTLKGCQLDEISQNVTASLIFLSYLDVSKNNIKLNKATFTKMVELDYIDLSNNNLAALDPYIFRANFKLPKIILDNNNFAFLPKLVCASGNFETYLFSCNNCNISNLPVDAFKHLPALITLSLAHNHISDVHLSAFQNLHSLIELDLSYNNINTIAPDVFSKSSGLEKLNLAGNHIVSIDSRLFEHHRVLETLDLSFGSLTQLWNQSINTPSSLKQLNIANNSLTKITVSELAVINNIKVIDLSNNPLECNSNLKDAITWLNEHQVSSISYSTHEKLDIIDAFVYVLPNNWNWKEVAKERCSEEYYIKNFDTKQTETEVIKKPTENPEDYDYHYGDFDSDEDLTASDEFDEADQLGKDIVGIKISEIISSSRNKNNDHYSFLWPTLVFIFTSLSVLIIAANIMLLMLRSTSISRKINIPHIKIPQWNSGNKLKKHSGSIYQPLSEEKCNSCISIPGQKEPVCTNDGNQNIP